MPKEVLTMLKGKSLQLWGAVLLLIGGLVHMIPLLYSSLAGLTGGTPWIQIIVGILSVLVSLVMFAGDKEEKPSSVPPTPPAV